MFRALLRKEWAQLRAIRWVGFGLGALLPFFLLVVAEAAKSGRLPFGRISDYSTDQLMSTALPLLGAGLWWLLALLLSAQTFAGDRAAGTERFLLERPVRRSRVWWARLSAALGSLTALMLAHLVVWLVTVRILAGSSLSLSSSDLPALCAIGALIGLVCFVAGVAASSFASTPLQAVLLGLILGALPPGLAMVLGGLSPLAIIAGVPLGLVVPWLLLPGYLVASFAISCRGEPAGKGRLRRGVAVLGACCATILVLFLAGVPWVLRARAGRLSGPEVVAAGGGGRAVCVIEQTWPVPAGWLIDKQRARKLRFLPPPVQTAAWNRDGSLLALAHHAESFGGFTASTHIEFLDEEGHRVGRGVRLSHDEVGWVKELHWVGEKLIAAVQLAGQDGAVLILSPESGVVHRVPIEEHAFRWDLLGPTAEGEMLVQLMVDTEARRYELRRLDLARSVLEPEPLAEAEGLPTWANRGISPSGRYWLARVGESRAGFRVIGLRGAEDVALPECLWARWMTGERLACLEEAGDGRRLTVGRPGEARAEIASWPGSSVVAEASPDGGRVLLQVWDPPDESNDDPAASTDRAFWSAGHGWRVGRTLREVLVYEDSTGALTDLTSRWGAAGPTADRPAVWAGPETLAFVGEGVLAFADLNGDSAPRYALGRP